MEDLKYADDATEQREPLKRKEGCLLTGLMVFAVLETAAGSISSMVINWSMEQVVFEGSLSVPDFRWLVVLGTGLLQVLFFLLLSKLVKSERSRTVYQTLQWAWLFFALLFPTRFLPLTGSQVVAVAQSGITVLFILAYSVITRRRLYQGSRAPKDIRPALTLGFALLTSIPWLLSGSLGSGLDTALALTEGLLFGYAASLVITRSILANIAKEGSGGLAFSQIVGWGSLAFITLLVMAGGIAQNGNQAALALAVPATGLGAVVINRAGHQENRDSAAPATIWIGLACAWTLMWFDPDELMAVVGMSGRDPMTLAVKAGASAMMLTLVLDGILIAASFSRWKGDSSRFKKTVTWLFPAFAAILAGVVYSAAGSPGLHGDRLFVILKSQTDLTKTATIGTPTDRRTLVYNDLVATANSTQAGLRLVLDRWGIPYTPYYLVNALEVDGGPLVRLWLKSRPEIDRVLESPVLRPLPEPLQSASGTADLSSEAVWNLTLIGADQAWEMGATGKGIVVGQSDSGVQGDHPELADSYRGRTAGGDYNWYDPWYGTTAPVDIGGHGTHTLGTVLGNRVGVAPDAEWIGCVNLARNLGNPALYLDCMQFMLAPFPLTGDPFLDGKPELGAQVLNNSWGCPPVEGCDADVMLPAVRALRSAGVFVVVSAGNSGYKGCGSLEAPPAIYDEVFSVGSVNQESDLSQFSSLGPVDVDGSGRVKPDIVAPGDQVLSSYPNSSYEIASGTSMAGPHVVGVVALLWSANPSLIGDIERTEEILRKTARTYQGSLPSCVQSDSVPNNAVGYGIVDAFQAVKMAVSQ